MPGATAWPRMFTGTRGGRISTAVLRDCRESPAPFPALPGPTVLTR